MAEPNLLGDQVCIVGGSSGRDNARLYAAPGWNVWCVARIYDQVPYATLVFEMHQNSNHWGPSTHTAYRDNKLILQASNPQFPNASILPIREIVEEFGTGFTSSFSWLIAYAIHRRTKTLSLCGVNMSHSSEIETQRPGLFYILGYARAKGVNIILPHTAHLRQEVNFPTN